MFKRLSYFAKTDTKIYGNGTHNFGCSRLLGRLQVDD
ncbi:inovirus Gp2 family protein [Shewanella profunda]|nr:inovirus Gp2 family protein [Shewanella profunda]